LIYVFEGSLIDISEFLQYDILSLNKYEYSDDEKQFIEQSEIMKLPTKLIIEDKDDGGFTFQVDISGLKFTVQGDMEALEKLRDAMIHDIPLIEKLPSAKNENPEYETLDIQSFLKYMTE